MALLSLALPVAGQLRTGLLIVGLAGASLFFGDAMITPAISVLSAVEGLGIVSPMVTPYVVPIAAVVLICLFLIQSRGSGAVGFLFGPVMAVWFATLAVAGACSPRELPESAAGSQPKVCVGLCGPCRRRDHVHGLRFGVSRLDRRRGALCRHGSLRQNPRSVSAGSCLCCPLLFWFTSAKEPSCWPIRHRRTIPFSFYFRIGCWPCAVLLTTAATVIASQAVLSGAFALVQQAIQLGAIPRLEVRQTSEESAGQVYVPEVNWLLAALVLALVFGFHSSDALANAYGIAVAGDMMVTTLLVTAVAYGLWRWPSVLVFPVAGLFFLLDLTFVSANIHKIPAGGWFPLLVGLVALTLMLVWRKGRRVAFERRDESAIALATFIASLEQPGAPERTNGTAVYLTKETDIVPAALRLNVKHNGIVHKHVVLLKVTTEHSPRVEEKNRVKVTPLPSGFRLLWLVFGFAEKPDVPAALRLHPEALECDPAQASFFLGRETPVPSLRPHLSAWQQRLYAFMVRNAVSAPDYFLIPSARVVNSAQGWICELALAVRQVGRP